MHLVADPVVNMVALGTFRGTFVRFSGVSDLLFLFGAFSLLRYDVREARERTALQPVGV